MNPDSPKPHIKTRFNISDNQYRWIANGAIFIGLILAACTFLGQPPIIVSPKTSTGESKPIAQPSSVVADRKATGSKPLSTDSLKRKEVNISKSTDTKHADTNPEDNTTLKDYWTINGTRGDFTAGVIGTIFSLGGFIYLFLSFKQQREANQQQNEAFEHDKIATRFFELIQLHRDNVSELEFKYKEIVFTGKTFFEFEVIDVDLKQRQVFQGIKDQFDDAFNELSHLFDDAGINSIYVPDYLTRLSANDTLRTRRIDYLKYAKVDLLYLIVFFGVGTSGREAIESLVQGKYQPAFMDKLLDYASLKPKANSKYFIKWLSTRFLENGDEYFDAILAKRKNPASEFPELTPKWLKSGAIYTAFDPYYATNYEKHYGGHQFRLGHYFRHLYQSVSFINKLQNSPGELQRDWVKHLRGQLSTPEQVLFFLNSLSQLGRVWELENTKTGAAVERSHQMVTDYKLIKNIPNDVVHADIKPSDFYPDIAYEGFNVVKPATN